MMWKWGKALGLLAISRSVVSHGAIQRALSNIVIILGIIMMLSVLAVCVALGALFAIYHGLLIYGLDTPAALTVVICLLVIGVVSLVSIMCDRIQLLKKARVFEDRSLSGKAAEILDAFTEGFMANAPPKP